MINKIYSVRDAKAGVFNSPFFRLSHGEAERTFHQLCNDDKSMTNQYPDDFDLYYLGDFDTVSGKISPTDTPQHMIKAVQVLNKNQSMTQRPNKIEKEILASARNS